MRRLLTTTVGLILLALGDHQKLAEGFYLPGIAPTDYETGVELEILANKLTSPKNQLPFDYYSMPYCKEDERVRSRPVNLGQLLVGERAKPTSFAIKMMIPQQCVFMCKKTLAGSRVTTVKKRIDDGYSVRLNMDNMPVVVKGRTKAGSPAFHFGYLVGFNQNGKYYINNHLQFKILHHKPSLSPQGLVSGESTAEVYRVVGFEVVPYSIKHVQKGKEEAISADSCPVKPGLLPQEVTEGVEVIFSYDVVFEESEILWATRWDPLLNANPELKQIQWFSIINSLMIGLFLTALVATILLRTVLRDFMRYNQLEEDDEAEDVTGWKLVHGDVFRAPPLSAVLAVMNGTGTQAFWMAFVTLLFAMAGFLSPANRGGLLTAMLTLWVLLSVVSGYNSARLYAALEGSLSRKAVTLGSAFIFPGGAFILFFSLNLLLWFNRSTGAVPFFALLLLLFMWFGVSVPLTFLGAYLGYKTKPYEFPVKTNQIPRQIPPPPLGISPWTYIVVAGVLPFGTVFMELVFIMNSIWQNQMYYMFGFLFLVFVILIVTCAEMSIVFTYLLLSNENWKWWWHAFLTSASSGVYVFLYSLYYLVTQPGLEGINFVSILLYLGYMGMISVAFCLLTGCVGFYSSFVFVRRIYSAIRVD
eukprot:CAMPEP_0184678342 /NCGR_PEP_ID=MMETSP0312-20130426/1076_1 /TAXON_ID=31354 /ORGANISM="Compsopogon coeruleus, Strain SAG 36.94" /LENGTH=641 /DNA_ID=CAMNT_0027127011 /DNA_START=213 /DNA_END=2138 /DNA_ORIENTATION=-